MANKLQHSLGLAFALVLGLLWRNVLESSLELLLEDLLTEFLLGTPVLLKLA